MRSRDYWVKPKTIAEEFWELVCVGKPDKCWQWLGSIGAGGYGRYYNKKFKNKSKRKKSHRLAWMYTNGKIPIGLKVLHHCDNPPCCNPSHMFLGTQVDNIVDMVKKKRHMRGVNQVDAKLSAIQVKEARNLWERGYLIKEVATLYKLSDSCMGRVVARKSYKDVE